MTSTDDDWNIPGRYLLAAFVCIVCVMYYLFFYKAPELGAELANEISESRIADAYEKAGIERTSVTDRYVLEYLDCSRGIIDTESEITCFNSTLGALDKSSLSEDEKASLKTGMQKIGFIRMIDLSSPTKTSVQVGVIQNPGTDKFEYVAMLTTDEYENREFYSDTDMLVNFVLESAGQGVQPIIWFNLFSPYTDNIIREYHKEKWQRFLDLKNKAIENNIQLLVKFYEHGTMRNGIFQHISSTKLTGISELEFRYLDLDIEDSTNMDYGDYVFIENIDEYEKFLNTLSVVGIVDMREYEIDFSNSFVIGIMSPSGSSCYKENLRSVVYDQSKITLLVEIEKKGGIQICTMQITKHFWVAVIEKPSLNIDEIEVVRN